MARSTVEDVFEDITVYSHAVVSYVGADGYPLSVATGFRPNRERGTIELEVPALPGEGIEGREVTVIFSHIRPYPGVGYDQRRYVTVSGRAAPVNGVLEVRPVKTHGWDEQRMSFFELCERSVPVAHEYMRELGEARGKPVKARMALGWLVFMSARLPFLTATIVPILLGALVARSHGFSNWGAVLLALLGGSAIHLGLNILNDVFDATSGADEANVTPTMFSGGSRMIQYGIVSLNSMRIAAAACYAVGIAIGFYFVATRGIELLWIGLAGVFLSIFYTAPPLRLVHRGLGEICVALGFGPIMVLGTYFVVTEDLSGEALYASLPVALLIMLVLYVNQIPDRPADARAGKNTIVVRLPREAIVAGFALSVAATFILIAAGPLLSITPAWTFIALATIPLAIKVHKGLKAHYDSPYELMATMGQNIMLHLFTGLLLIAGYTLDVVV
ncbi:MAG: prenyltransferase [Actinomycetota bacterium]